MLMPRVFDNMFDDWMDFSFPEFDGAAYNRNPQETMRTDVKETEQGYEVDMELPGFKKEDVKAQLKDGYLTISAQKAENKDEKDKEGKYIRKERYSGSVSRQFYVGEQMTEEDIHAKFEDGMLKLTLPKKEAKHVEENRYIAIEG
ncbi:MAG: Hsp20/alpha crystallin family protein [Eubacteriales bacterium]|nr:Hsp20/alpha crystallin family protein [Eubacteriales bacterium]